MCILSAYVSSVILGVLVKGCEGEAWGWCIKEEEETEREERE